MAEVKWQARRVSDGVLVDVTGDVVGTVIGAPTANALEGAGSGSLTVDNTDDPPAEITTLIAPRAVIVGDEASLPTKDFYAQDDDPGDVGAGSVWKDTDAAPKLYRERNAANDGWDANADTYVTGVADEDAFARMSAQTTGTGAAYSGPVVSTDGAGNADARPIATSGGSALGAASTGAALAGPQASSDDGSANVQASATTTGEGEAFAGSEATANGTGEATVVGNATAVSGKAQVESFATSNSITAGMYAEVSADVPKLGFNAVAVGGGVTIPVVPVTTPDVQDVIDALVALGLITQSD